MTRQSRTGAPVARDEKTVTKINSHDRWARKSRIKIWSSLSTRKRTNPVNLTSGWLDAITEGADFPQLTDIGGALIVFNNLTCSDYSVHAFRRFPIPYQMFGRERRYKVEDVVAYARRCLDEAPVRTPAPRPRPKRIRPSAVADPQPLKSAPERAAILIRPPPDPAVRQHESGDQRERVSEATS
jgi:hypothetical protein